MNALTRELAVAVETALARCALPVEVDAQLREALGKYRQSHEFRRQRVDDAIRNVLDKATQVADTLNAE